jgi:hypothetical protein
LSLFVNKYSPFPFLPDKNLGQMLEAHVAYLGEKPFPSTQCFPNRKVKPFHLVTERRRSVSGFMDMTFLVNVSFYLCHLHSPEIPPWNSPFPPSGRPSELSVSS